MPKHGTDALHRLIHSLDRSEKGYVKRYCTRHTIGDEVEYLAVFDIVDGMDVYDEEVVKSRLTSPTHIRRLASIKSHLYQQILEAMRVYHAAKSAERTITELLLDADFLWEKALYDQAMKRVMKAKALAKEHDEFTFWLKTISWEKNYRGVVLERPQGDATTDALSEEQDTVIDLMRSTIEYEKLGNLLQSNLMRRTTGDASVDSWLRSLPSHPLLQDAALARSRPARLNYHMILSNWYAFVGADPEKAVYHAGELLQMVDREPTLTTARPDLELGVLQTYLQRCVDARMFDVYRTQADRLWDPSGKKPSRNIDVKRFYYAMTTELGYAVLSSDHDQVLPKLTFMRERFTALREQIPEQSRLSASFLAARLCIEASKTREAGFWIRSVFEEDDDVRTDLHIATRLLQLRMFADERDVDAMRSAVRSLTRLSTNRQMRTMRLDATLSYFRRFAEALTPRERTKLRNECIAKLGALAATTPFDTVTSAGIEEWLGMAARSGTAAVQPGLNY